MEWTGILWFKSMVVKILHIKFQRSQHLIPWAEPKMIQEAIFKDLIPLHCANNGPRSNVLTSHPQDRAKN